MPAVMQAAAEIDQALGTVEERGEEVRSHDVDRQDLGAAKHTGVVDHRVHPPEDVHVVRELARLLELRQVADHGRGAEVLQVAHRREPVRVASVHDHVVPLLEQGFRSQPSEAVRGAGDEDACDPVPPLRT